MSGLAMWAALTEQDLDADWPHETELRAKLLAWKQWMLGDGVASQAGRMLVLDEATARVLENKRDDFRLPIAVADAERTNRAVIELRNTDSSAWRAIECYHFRNTSHRQIAKAAKTHHMRVPELLKRGHESLYYFYNSRASA